MKKKIRFIKVCKVHKVCKVCKVSKVSEPWGGHIVASCTTGRVTERAWHSAARAVGSESHRRRLPRKWHRREKASH